VWCVVGKLCAAVQSVLGVDAVMNQRNVVQVETLNFSNERLHLPIISLTLGRNDMVSLLMLTPPVVITSKKFVKTP